MVHSTIRSYYLIVALTTLGQALHSATYVTFLMRQGSLDLFAVNLVNVFFFATVALMEVPTGVFADVFGRRASFLVSCALTGTGLFVYGASTGFWGFVLAEMTIGLGITFASGAFDAWIVDQLGHHGFEGPFENLFSRSAMLGKVVGMASAMVGAAIFDHAMALPWYLGGAAYFASGVVAWRLMREDYFTRVSAPWRTHWSAMRETVRKGFALSRESPTVRFVTLLVAVQAFAVQAPNMQWQPFFGKFFVSQLGQGFIWVGIGLSTIAGAALAPRVRRIFGDSRRSLVALQTIAGLGIVATTLFAAQLGAAVAMFLVHEAARGAFDPLRDSHLARGITSSAERATILSFQSLFKYAGGTIGLVVSGWVANSVSLGAGWMLSGAVLALTGLVLWQREA